MGKEKSYECTDINGVSVVYKTLYTVTDSCGHGIEFG